MDPPHDQNRFSGVQIAGTGLSRRIQRLREPALFHIGQGVIQIHLGRFHACGNRLIQHFEGGIGLIIFAVGDSQDYKGFGHVPLGREL